MFSQDARLPRTRVTYHTSDMPWKRDIEALVELPSIYDMTIVFLVSLGAFLISGAQTSVMFTTQRASDPCLDASIIVFGLP